MKKDAKQAVVLLGYACNLNCRYCEYGEEDRKLSLTERQLEQIADGFNPKKVNLMGGEPLLSPLFDRALEVFSPSPVTVQTNGLLVPQKLKQLERVRQVIVSLEGNKRWNDYLRGKGTHEKVLKAVRLLKEHSIPVLLRATVSRQSLRQVDYLLKLAEREADGIYFYPLLGEKFSLGEVLWLFERMSRHKNSWIDLPSYFGYLGVGGFCAAGESRLAFFPDGTISPCQWMNKFYYLGRIGDDPSLVWENVETFCRLKRPPEDCTSCQFCWTCRGGCMLLSSFPCPLKYREFVQVREGDGFRQERARELKVLLRGVVTCAIALFAIMLPVFARAFHTFL
jgi:radical SAM protein with 4Fe4S-binding SPASM domain